MRSPEEQRLIRTDIFRWLDALQISGQYEFTREQLSSYSFNGERLPLLDRGRGIRNPRDFDSTLSIMTSHDSPYADALDDEQLLTYAYRAGDSADNRKLKAAHTSGDPIIYFRSVRPGVFVASYPAYVVRDHTEERYFSVAVGESMKLFSDPLAMTEDLRRYAERTVQVRLHQPVFRALVLHAYENACSICSLNHPALLDAAHIVPDSANAGFARVDNGLALCKIHHAAYDRNFLGISGDYTIKVRPDLMKEEDGPMLRHGIQEMDGRSISVPRTLSNRPSAVSLQSRFAEFEMAIR